jgi:hypothetical protein
MLDASLVRELVEAEDLLPVIWKAMAGYGSQRGRNFHPILPNLFELPLLSEQLPTTHFLSAFLCFPSIIALNA